MTRQRLADGSVSGQRMQSAAVRALDAHIRVSRMAKRLCEEMDDVTSPGVLPNVDLTEEDSVVTTIEAVRSAHVKPS